MIHRFLIGSMSLRLAALLLVYVLGAAAAGTVVLIFGLSYNLSVTDRLVTPILFYEKHDILGCESIRGI